MQIIPNYYYFSLCAFANAAIPMSGAIPLFSVCVGYIHFTWLSTGFFQEPVPQKALLSLTIFQAHSFNM